MTILHAGWWQAKLGVEGVELGMAHRGRLNVLVNLFGKPLGAICNEFTESDMSGKCVYLPVCIPVQSDM